MRKPLLDMIAAWLVLFALSVGASARGLVQCEEPDGRIAIEFADGHGHCRPPAPTGHQHDEYLPGIESCEACSSCPCNDTPLTLAFAVPGTRSALKQVSATDRGLVLHPPLPAFGPKCDRVRVIPANHSPTAMRSLRRYLRSVVILV